MASEEHESDTTEGERKSRYDDELLSANWNPAIELLGCTCGRTSQEAFRSAAQELAEDDVHAFLGRIYALGS